MLANPAFVAVNPVPTEDVLNVCECPESEIPVELEPELGVGCALPICVPVAAYSPAPAHDDTDVWRV